MLAKPATAVVNAAIWPRWDICPESEVNNVSICRICEHPCDFSVPSLTCSGHCLGVFHAGCVPSTLTNDNIGLSSFMCDQCRTGIQHSVLLLFLLLNKLHQYCPMSNSGLTAHTIHTIFYSCVLGIFIQSLNYCHCCYVIALHMNR